MTISNESILYFFVISIKNEMRKEQKINAHTLIAHIPLMLNANRLLKDARIYFHITIHVTVLIFFNCIELSVQCSFNPQQSFLPIFTIKIDIFLFSFRYMICLA